MLREHRGLKKGTNTRSAHTVVYPKDTVCIGMKIMDPGARLPGFQS